MSWFAFFFFPCQDIANKLSTPKSSPKRTPLFPKYLYSFWHFLFLFWQPSTSSTRTSRTFWSDDKLHNTRKKDMNHIGKWPETTNNRFPILSFFFAAIQQSVMKHLMKLLSSPDFFFNRKIFEINFTLKNANILGRNAPSPFSTAIIR